MNAAKVPVAERDIVDELVTRSLWSAPEASTIRTAAPWWVWGGRVLCPALAALIDDHDLNLPSAPAAGSQRVASVWRWIEHRAADVDAAAAAHDAWRAGTEGPEPENPYRSAAASYQANRYGRPDPALLRHARAVLTVLPGLVAPDERYTVTTTELLERLDHVRTANLAAALLALEAPGYDRTPQWPRRRH